MTSFTVITCTYNAAGVIGTTMESIASQTYPHVEHIVQDGESSDDTLRIVRIYPRVKVVSEPDSGLYDAMNKVYRIHKRGRQALFLHDAGRDSASDRTFQALRAPCCGIWEYQHRGWQRQLPRASPPVSP